jgi:hypothetical protein
LFYQPILTYRPDQTAPRAVLQDPELRVVFLDNLLEALGFADGVFDLGQVKRGCASFNHLH